MDKGLRRNPAPAKGEVLVTCGCGRTTDIGGDGTKAYRCPSCHKVLHHTDPDPVDPVEAIGDLIDEVLDTWLWPIKSYDEMRPWLKRLQAAHARLSVPEPKAEAHK